MITYVDGEKRIEIVQVTDEEAIGYTRRLAKEEGILTGISSDAVCCAAVKIAKKDGMSERCLSEGFWR